MRALLGVVLFTLACGSATGEQSAITGEVSSRNQAFLETIGRSGRYELEQLERALDDWNRIQAFATKGIDSPAESRAQARDFIRATLVTLEPDYARGIAELDQGQAAMAAETFLGILEADSPFPQLEAYCKLGLGQAMFDLGRHEEARVTLASLIERDAGAFSHRAEALFDLARSLEALGLRSAELAAYRRILDEHADDAPPAILDRARERTRRETGEAAADDSPMGEIAGLMGRSEGRLRESDTGKETQEVQKEIVDKLEELIKQAEEAEKSGGAASAASQSSSPAGAPSLPGGQGEPRNLNRVSEADAEEAWGSLPEREREKVMQTLAEKFPARYQELLEQYYKDIQAER